MQVRVKLSDRTEKRKVVKKGGEVEEVEGTEAAATREVSAEARAEIMARYAGAKAEPKARD